jgi:Relaxase/Mobilisation nuclease domain
MIAKTSIGGSFAGALNYGADEKEQGKNATLIFKNNLVGDSPMSMAKEMESVSKFSRCSKPVWHTSLSWQIGEQPSQEQLLKATNFYCEQIGADLSRHQVAVYQHHDTAHPHIHIYLNRIPLDGSTALSDSHYKYKAKQISRAMELALDFKPIPLERSSLKEKRPVVSDARQKVHDCITKGLSERCCSVEDLSKFLEKRGIASVFKHDSQSNLVGVSFRVDEIAVKGTEVGYKAKQLSSLLLANEAFYKKEIEDLQRALEIERSKPKELKEVVVERSVIKEIIKIDPHQQAEIERLRQLNNENVSKANRIIAEKNQDKVTIEQANERLSKEKEALQRALEIERSKPLIKEENPHQQAEIARLRQLNNESVSRANRIIVEINRDKVTIEQANERLLKEKEALQRALEIERSKPLIREETPQQQAEIARLQQINRENIVKANQIISEKNVLIKELLDKNESFEKRLLSKQQEQLAKEQPIRAAYEQYVKIIQERNTDLAERQLAQLQERTILEQERVGLVKRKEEIERSLNELVTVKNFLGFSKQVRKGDLDTSEISQLKGLLVGISASMKEVENKAYQQRTMAFYSMDEKPRTPVSYDEYRERKEREIAREQDREQSKKQDRGKGFGMSM